MIDNPLNRNKVKRGSQLTQSKLDEDDIRIIRSAVEHREQLKAEAKALSNSSLADKFGVHVRTIDRITSGFGWTHV